MLVISTHCLADTVYPIGSFSDQFTATVTFKGDIDEQSKKEGHISQVGYVSVYNKQGKRIVKESNGHLFVDINPSDGQARANVVQLPYGEQSMLIYDDFNFDGQKDLAIMDGQNSCYGGPSFQVYTGHGSGFKHDANLTRLAQEYCGMFDWDNKTRTINTMTKDGCCWHQSNTYQYIGNKLTLMKSSEERLLMNHSQFFGVDDKVRVANNRYKIQSWVWMYEEEDKPSRVILGFPVAQKSASDKYVTVYKNDEGDLDYIFTRGKSEGRIEYSYELDSTGEMAKKREFKTEFTYHKNNGMLEFSSPEATYRIYDTADKLGIEVVQKGRSVFLAGERGAKLGDLTQLDMPKKDDKEHNYIIKP